MSEPSQRPSEKLLKAAGARRREQAGTPEMHPATREVLLTEVRRQYGSTPGRARSGSGWLTRLLPKLAVFVALGVCAWLLIFRNGEQTPMHLAMDETTRSSELNGKEQVRRTDSAAVVEMGREEFKFSVAKGESMAVRSEPVVVAGSAMDSRATQPATSPRAQVSEERPRSVVGAGYFKSDRQGMYMGTAAAEAEAAIETDQVVALDILTGSTPDAVRRTAEPSIIPASAPVPASVLRNFTVFREGNTVRVVDADGSTYTGAIQTVSPTLSGHAVAPADTLSPGFAGDSATTSPRVDDNLGDLLMLNYRLVAEGTNRSLGQTVRFSGDLALTELQAGLDRNVFSNTLASVAGEKVETVPVSPERTAKGRLRGTAMLEDGRGVMVDAVPITP